MGGVCIKGYIGMHRLSALPPGSPELVRNVRMDNNMETTTILRGVGFNLTAKTKQPHPCHSLGDNKLGKIVCYWGAEGFSWREGEV